MARYGPTVLPQGVDYGSAIANGLNAFVQARRQSAHQIQDGVGGGAGPLERRAFLFFQFLQVAVDRRLRAGVTQRDTYRINRGVLSLGEQRIASTLNVKTTESGTGHGVRI